MKFELDAHAAIGLLNEAIQSAKAAGLPWRDEPLVLKPARKLVDLVRKSQDLAVKSSDDEGEAT
jgi:CRISPR-associated protein Csb1